LRQRGCSSLDLSWARISPGTSNQPLPCQILRPCATEQGIDEATSALDTESELEIQAALVRLMRDRTVISVAHRLSTLAAFDRILVVSGGRIVEDGRAADLRRQGGLFDRMWRLQAEGLSGDEVLDAA
jgi:ATP-binding cassette, subfamily B, bacterial